MAVGRADLLRFLAAYGETDLEAMAASAGYGRPEPEAAPEPEPLPRGPTTGVAAAGTPEPTEEGGRWFMWMI